jgi:hypothetical protein
MEAEKFVHLDVTDVAQKIRAYQARYELDIIVIDNANKQAVQELQRRHDLPLRAADKTGKSDFIEIMNGEFIQGRIKVDPQAARGRPQPAAPRSASAACAPESAMRTAADAVRVSGEKRIGRAFWLGIEVAAEQLNRGENLSLTSVGIRLPIRWDVAKARKYALSLDGSIGVRRLSGRLRTQG